MLRDGEVVTRQAHNLKIVGSNPTPAILVLVELEKSMRLEFFVSHPRYQNQPL